MSRFFRLPALLAGLLLVAACATTPPPPRAQVQPQPAAPAPAPKPQNVILFISDGTGPASITLARDYRRVIEGREALALDGALVGSVRTYSSNSRVTDSAAGATAYSAGIKTYNGAIAVDTSRRAVATLLEGAEAKGMATGLIATSRITHATPASFAAHVPSRGMEEEIAAQMMTAGVDVLVGGGRAFFEPAADGGRRQDGRDLLAEARDAGATVALDREAWAAARSMPLVALLSEDHMAYEIDRDSLVEPSLAEMTAHALDLLDDDPDGFFLMVEGSRIDHAGHGNDAAAHLHDLLAYDDAFAVALDYVRRHPGTLLVSTSDHETGGLTLGRNLDGRGIYAWYPEALARVRASHWPIMELLGSGEQPAEDVIREMLGIDDLSDPERAMIDRAVAGEMPWDDVLTELVGRRAVLGWTTNGHTGVDVHLYAAGTAAERFRGSHENTTVGRLLAELMELDLEALTQQLHRTASAE